MHLQIKYIATLSSAMKPIMAKYFHETTYNLEGFSNKWDSIVYCSKAQMRYSCNITAWIGSVDKMLPCVKLKVCRSDVIKSTSNNIEKIFMHEQLIVYENNIRHKIHTWRYNWRVSICILVYFWVYPIIKWRPMNFAFTSYRFSSMGSSFRLGQDCQSKI